MYGVSRHTAFTGGHQPPTSIGQTGRPCPCKCKYMEKKVGGKKPCRSHSRDGHLKLKKLRPSAATSGFMSRKIKINPCITEKKTFYGLQSLNFFHRKKKLGKSEWTLGQVRAWISYFRGIAFMQNGIFTFSCFSNGVWHVTLWHKYAWFLPIVSLQSEACTWTDGRLETNLGHGCMSTASYSGPLWWIPCPISTVKYL